LVFVPETTEMYPHGFSTNVGVSDLTEDLCGASRPNHFDGVATVVTKLLLQCAPDLALFGEKDYQQLPRIRRPISRPRNKRPRRSFIKPSSRWRTIPAKAAAPTTRRRPDASSSKRRGFRATMLPCRTPRRWNRRRVRC